MIPRPNPASRQPGPLSGPLSGTAAATPAAPVPAWLRRAVQDAQGARNLAGHGARPPAFEDVALVAGAALGALDTVVRRRQRWAGAWRRRLALAAAATTARQAGRAEDEAALRDAVLLARADDHPCSGPADPGPAGRLLLAWRQLAALPAEDLLTDRNLGATLEAFGHAGDDEAAGDLASASRQLAAGAATAGLARGAFAIAERFGYGRAVAAWLADALLAQRLGWPQALPLLGGEAAPAGGGQAAGRARRLAAAVAAAGPEAEADRAAGLLAAQARAALRAVDLSAALGRRADRLLAVAPKLRARGADVVVGRLLDEDALVAAHEQHRTGMSDRGLRRLFDRLVQLGAARELSGRPTFRLYGL